MILSYLEWRADYRACASAARNFAVDWAHGRGSELIDLDFDTCPSPSHARLPCERLFLDP